MGFDAQKQCPYCRENIPGAAKICPRCRQWLSFWSLRNPLSTIIVYAACMLALVLCFSRMFNRLTNPPPYYADTPAALKILQSQMFFKDSKDGPRIYITGILTNQSPTPWHGIEFDCRFFGTNGNLVDAYTAQSYLTVLGGDDAAFRLTIPATKAAQDYGCLKLFISNARNTKGIF